MKKLSCIMRPILFLVVLYSSMSLPVFSAKLFIQAPQRASSNRQPVVVQVFLDAENDALSGIAGDFSFPEKLFTVESIDLEGSVVSLWAKQPSLGEERYLDGNTHLTFEGAFPGGYRGVRSPYYQGTRPGIVFTILLTPKQEGFGSFSLTDLAINAFNEKATPLPITSSIVPILVPTLQQEVQTKEPSLHFTESKTLTATIARDPLVAQGAWYVLVNEREPRQAIKAIYVAESTTYAAESVNDLSFRSVANPFVLTYQDRSRYVHVKVVYTDNTYTLRTLMPVENSKPDNNLSRILIGVVALVLVAYFFSHAHSARSKKHS